MVGVWQRAQAAVQAFQAGGVRQRSAAWARQSGRSLSRSLSWSLGGTDIQALTRGNLPIMRRESRRLAINSDHMRGFLRLVERNVVGDSGVRMQGRLALPDGERDEDANSRLEQAWADWGCMGSATVCGRFSFVQVQKIIMQQVARDGEVLVRLVRGYPNAYRFALQILNADALDFNYHTRTGAGHEVRSGIELDGWGRPVAYHVNLSTDGQTLRRERIPAEDILHLFVPLDAGQYRGWPWVHSAIRRILKTTDYEDAALDAARKGAKHGGFIVNRSEESLSHAPVESGPSSDVEVSLENGTVEILPEGYEFQGFDPNYPSAQMPDFMRHMLRGAATGLGVSYTSLTGDLTQVNYSSARIGLGEERDEWSSLQTWLVEHCIAPIYRAWLDQALLAGQLDFGAERRTQARRSQWYPRRWRAVDPDKESRARARDVALGITSRTRIAAQDGADIRDVLDELQQEQELARSMGLTLGAPEEAAPVEIQPPDAQ